VNKAENSNHRPTVFEQRLTGAVINWGIFIGGWLLAVLIAHFVMDQNEGGMLWFVIPALVFAVGMLLTAFVIIPVETVLFRFLRQRWLYAIWGAGWYLLTRLVFTVKPEQLPGQTTTTNFFFTVICPMVGAYIIVKVVDLLAGVGNRKPKKIEITKRRIRIFLFGIVIVTVIVVGYLLYGNKTDTGAVMSINATDSNSNVGNHGANCRCWGIKRGIIVHNTISPDDINEELFLYEVSHYTLASEGSKHTRLTFIKNDSEDIVIDARRRYGKLTVLSDGSFDDEELFEYRLFLDDDEVFSSSDVTDDPKNMYRRLTLRLGDRRTIPGAFSCLRKIGEPAMPFLKTVENDTTPLEGAVGLGMNPYPYDTIGDAARTLQKLICPDPNDMINLENMSDTEKEAIRNYGLMLRP